MELCADWFAVVADDDVRRHGLADDPRAEQFDWRPIDVPGHWENSDGFAGSSGPLMYRHRFHAPPPADGRRRWLTLDGVMYQADVWLDGAYLGDPEGYFGPHSFDITALSQLGDEHVLAVEVTCSPQSHNGRRNLTGALQPDLDAPNPGGLWRPVVVYDTGPVRIDRLRVLCRDADDRRAHLRLLARVDSDRQRTVTVRTSVTGAADAGDERDFTVAAGVNEIEWTLDITDPQLWWPRTLGEQALATVAVEVLVDGQCSDRRERRTGLRQVDWDNWVCSVNGERLFLKGATIDPRPTALGDPAAPDAAINTATTLGLDALRFAGYIADRRWYAAADEAGLVVLQDFPLQGGHARSVRAQAVEQARAAVDHLAHHPCVVMWSAHNNPVPTASSTGDRRRLAVTAGRQLPSWNKTVLDRWVKRALEDADPTRLTIAHSGVVAHLPQLDGTDGHLSYGWSYGAIDDLGRRARRQPRSVRFVSEFGAASAGNATERRALTAVGGPGAELLAQHFDPARFTTDAEWRNATQAYQAELLRRQIETLRKLKFQPTGGFSFATLFDTAPIGFGVVDNDGAPKAAFESVRAACAPLIVVAEPLPTAPVPGRLVRVDVHAVNAERAPVEGVTLEAVLTWPAGSRRWQFGGVLPADEVVLIGRVQFDVPALTYGDELALTLTLTTPTGALTPLATNRYVTCARS
ncbi:MAG: hypothetical protein HRT86_04455 [Ilumatobacteraceae bacterium]|nr:hypothetical protein [Ilumatobacteraceae bacterium]